MSVKNEDKKAVLAINKIVIAFLVIFVVILVILFWFKLDIPGKLNLLIPGFNNTQSGEDEPINIDDISLDQRCKISCAPFGLCKDEGEDNEIWVENIKCQKSTEKCFVKESESTLENGDLKIRKFEIKVGSNVKDLLGVTTPEEANLFSDYNNDISINFLILYPNDYCYYLRTNSNNILKTGDIFNEFIRWKPIASDKFLELIAWDIGNKDKFVSRRIKLIPPTSGPPLGGYLDGKKVDDTQFKDMMLNSKIGDRFYVLGIRTDNFRNKGYIGIAIDFGIKVVDDGNGKRGYNIYISPALQSDRGVSSMDDWNQLDCNGDFNIFRFFDYKTLDEEDIKNTFKETLESNCGF